MGRDGKRSFGFDFKRAQGIDRGKNCMGRKGRIDFGQRNFAVAMFVLTVHAGFMFCLITQGCKAVWFEARAQ